MNKTEPKYQLSQNRTFAIRTEQEVSNQADKKMGNRIKETRIELKKVVEKSRMTLFLKVLSLSFLLLLSFFLFVLPIKKILVKEKPFSLKRDQKTRR